MFENSGCGGGGKGQRTWLFHVVKNGTSPYLIIHGEQTSRYTFYTILEFIL